MFSSITFIFSLSLVFGSILAAPVRRAASATDILVFQFAHVLELLETDFYTQALAKFQDSDFTAAGFGNVNVPKEIFTVILSDETTHTSVLETAIIALGAQPLTTCKFDFGEALKDVATMAATARVIENTGVAAYLGGANLLGDKELLIAAATILTVEARHQSVLNILNTATSIPSAFDIALSPDQVLAIAGGFITGCDLGIKALPSLSVTNTGTIGPGTSLTFSSTGIPSGDQSGLTCQMMTGGAPFAQVFPFNACVVPDINGPVYIYIVNDTQPLLNDLTDQFAASIVAGPHLTFIDSQPETLGEVVKDASAVVGSSTTISAAQATALAQSASANVTSTTSTNDTATASTSVSSIATNSTSNSTSEAAVTVIGWSNLNGTDSTSAANSTTSST